MNTFKMVADVKTSDMLDLPVPELEGGKAEIIVTERTEAQSVIMDSLVERAEAIRAKQVNKYEDNMLCVTGDAKLMAIDPRLIDPKAENDPNSKLNVCIDNVFKIWGETSEKRLAQIIFCDSGTPNPEKFNVYSEVKKRLIEKGVPKEEIAFIHDADGEAAREKMMEKTRNGEIRVLLGSTSKLGTGTNVQRKLVAAHHVDVPWRPADITQRDGRILRQGNENPAVRIFRYVTKGTFVSSVL